MKSVRKNLSGLASERTQRLRADLALLLVAIVWGSAFAAQRLAAEQISAFTFNGLRFLIGALVLLPLTWRCWERLDRTGWMGVALVGSVLFAGAAFQQLGLRYTTAGNAGFVTGLYVVLIPLILALGWKEPPRRIIWPASLLAATGMFLISTGGKISLKLGDMLELTGACMFALHVILIGILVRKVEVLQLAVSQYLVCGMLSLLVGLGLGGSSLSGLASVWWAIAYTGIFSVGLGYTLQARAQKIAPPADAAILLSLEAVFAALFGWLLLDERLSPPQLLGCGLMLTAMILAQVSSFMRPAVTSDEHRLN
jgi:drug/metabolite transporter (DMT)-like permease